MRIFVVTNDMHIPKPGGAQEDIYAFCRRLTELGHETALVTLHTPNQSPEALEAARRESRVPVVPIEAAPESLGRWFARSLAEPSFFDRPAYLMRRMVESTAYATAIQERKPELIIGFCAYTWPAFADAKRRGLRSLFRSHNYEPDFFMEALDPTDRFRPSNWIRYVGKYFSERRAVRWSDATCSTPLREIARYERWKGAPVTTLTLAYLSDWLRAPRTNPGKKPLDVFYLGASYNVPYHRRGVETLIEKIAPLAEAKAPGAFRFHICGNKLPARLKAQCDGTRLIYEDYVPDLQAFLDGMDISIAPVDTGRSIKGKVFGPICRSFPMIISPLCLSLQPLEDGKNVLVAETPEDYVEGLQRLRDDRERERLAQGAHAYAQKYCSAEAIKAAIRAAIDSAVRA